MIINNISKDYFENTYRKQNVSFIYIFLSFLHYVIYTVMINIEIIIRYTNVLNFTLQQNVQNLFLHFIKCRLKRNYYILNINIKTIRAIQTI